MLLNKLPESVMIDDKEYAINTDFRVALEFERLTEELQEQDETALLIAALALFFGSNLPSNIQGAVDSMLWFYSGGKTPKRSQKEHKRILDFEYDSDYIYAAFLDQYRIDLTEIEYMHWWKFRAMFMALREDIEVVKIMGYRALDTRNLKGEQKKHYERLKKAYALPRKQMVLTEEEKALNDELAEAARKAKEQKKGGEING
ncbi:MAG: bacteriophage Gp15 family protein [Lachnospiraceae bacterium]|jgi:hypothetical protein|nr:bacteriophage Gp15 family protein [Lachnospiraceae bacterium]